MSIEFGDDKIPFIDLGKGFKIRLEYEEITDEKYVTKAKDELRETPELLQKSLEEFKEMIRSQ